jgi:hypothetical protein
MIEQYELYCMTDPVFYEAPDVRGTDEQLFPIGTGPVPEDWNHHPDDTWMYYQPRTAAVLPTQGWKIHVSSRVADAERVLSAVWDYCVPRNLAFKFLRSESVMVMLNSKAAERGASGKLVTIYPPDIDQLELVLKELDVILSGVAGPYILSDLRYGDGPLYVRYGGFAPRYCLAPNGERMLALEDGAGNLVPDVRGPTFVLPPWVTLPSFLESHLAARNAITTSGLPYEIESVLQFSNGGGVYLARDRRTEQQVVLKEGRPHAGLDVAGRDAVTRLTHERDILLRLAGLEFVPAVLDYFALGEHHFLVTEFVDANPLQRLLVHRFPLIHPDCTAEAIAEYTEWALAMIAKVERAVDALHRRGVVFGDLHPFNILVNDDRLVLIDFEVATLAEDRARSALAHPAFQPPADRVGVNVDRYALACLRLGMFAPQATMMLPLHVPKARQLAHIVVETFPVPHEVIDDAVAEILGVREPAPEPLADLPLPGLASWESVRSAMCRAIRASATPDRDDRLFPGDIAQFTPGGGINLAHGAAGVLHALAVTGAGRCAEHEDWLLDRARRGGQEVGPGFYDGQHGVAYVLNTLGYRQDALDVVARCRRDGWEAWELGLYGGLAGVGLNLLHLSDATGEPGLRELADQVVDLAADRLGAADSVPKISGGNNPRAGLMWGSSGPALLFLHTYERTGDSGLLDLAEVALRQDLRRCVLADDGTYQVDQGWRTLPYLDEGSVGIALVLARYLTHREDPELAAARTGLESVTRCGYFVQSGLFTGRAGILATAGMLGLPATAALVRDLRWHALPHGDGLAFPGDQLLRLSMDLATGAAGVLLALGTALHDGPVGLPFLEPPLSGLPMPAATRASRATGRSSTTRPRKEV